MKPKEGIVLIAFTAQGADLGQRIAQARKDTLGYTLEKYAAASGLIPLQGSLSDWTATAFGEKRGIIFVSACGIAVRAIAPFLQDKATDPAVVTVDEKGKFVVSLLSGHLGGGNALARELAALLSAQAVISTATDLNHQFAVDLWAQQQQLCILEASLAKEVSASILNGEAVGFVSDFSQESPIPKGLVPGEGTAKLGICVSYDTSKQPFSATLHLVPKGIVLGIGCRKGVPEERIEEFVFSVLESQQLPFAAVCALASIDLKKEEVGLLAFCQKYDLALHTFSGETLLQTKGDFTYSAFVEETTGVANVCERSAVCASEGILLFPKQKGKGLTLAAAGKQLRVK